MFCLRNYSAFLVVTFFLIVGCQFRVFLHGCKNSYSEYFWGTFVLQIVLEDWDSSDFLQGRGHICFLTRIIKIMFPSAAKFEQAFYHIKNLIFWTLGSSAMTWIYCICSIHLGFSPLTKDLETRGNEKLLVAVAIYLLYFFFFFWSLTQ